MVVAGLLAVERLSADELNALAAHEQAHALNEIMAEMARVGNEAIKARNRLARARQSLVLADREDPASKDLRKSEVIAAQAVLDNLRERSRTLRELKSILQTLLRSLSP